MMQKPIHAMAIVALVLIAFGLVAPAAAQTADKAVRIDAGMIEGAMSGGVLSFKGMPYAAPPLGDLRWCEPQPVETWTGIRQATEYGHGWKERLDLVAQAPDTSETVLPSDVMDVTWQWVSFTTPVEQVNVDAPERYTLQFGRDGRITLRADCNRGGTTYSVSADRRIALKPIALTRMMCPPGSLSDRYVKEIGRATSYFLKDGDLFLELPVDSGTLRFRRQG